MGVAGILIAILHSSDPIPLLFKIEKVSRETCSYTGSIFFTGDQPLPLPEWKGKDDEPVLLSASIARYGRMDGKPGI